MKSRFLLLMLIPLTSCYTLNQERFTNYATETVPAGTAWNQAISRLAADGFRCEADGAVATVSCTRLRQSLLPYTCIERIQLQPDAEKKIVDTVKVPAIACAGL